MSGNSPPVNDLLSAFLEICSDIGHVRGKRISTLLRGGWDDVQMEEARLSRAETENRLRVRAETRRDTSRLCNLVALIMPPPERTQSVKEDQEDASTKADNVTFTRRSFSRSVGMESTIAKSDRYRDKLSRSVVGAPATPVHNCHGKLETWMTEGLPPSLEENDGCAATDWVVGDATLVFWCQKWHSASVVDIGGQKDGVISLRLRPHGCDSSSDLWIRDREWSFRLRPVFVTAKGGGRLERGHCGHPGDRVSLSWFDCAEHSFWLGSGLVHPVGRVVSQQNASRDGVEVEVTTLGTTEKIHCANSLLRVVDEETFNATEAHVKAVRAEARRLIDAIHAGAVTGLEQDQSAPAREAPEEQPQGSRVWHGLRVISGRRTLIAVNRAGGHCQTITQKRGATAMPAAQAREQSPTWLIRLTSPVTRQWMLTQIPPDILARVAETAFGTADLSWEADEKKAALIARGVVPYLRVCSGSLEWSGVVSTTVPADHHPQPPSPAAVQPSSPRACLCALLSAFPSPAGGNSEALHTLPRLVFWGVTCDVSLVARRGGGDLDGNEDGVRVMVMIHGPPPAPNQRRKGVLPCRVETLVVEAVDWQWVRPWGVNAGSLPALRWLTPPLRALLLRCLAARLHPCDGSLALRLPHRTIYPLGFAPFRARPPLSGEKAWAEVARRGGNPEEQSGSVIVWRASMALTEEDSDGESAFGGRWLVTTRAQGHDLVAEAQRIGPSSPRRNERLRLSLNVADWRAIGFGPLQFMSFEQKQHLSRRLVYPGITSLVRTRDGESTEDEGALSLVVQLQPSLDVDDNFYLEDMGESVAVVMKKEHSQPHGGPPLTKVLLSARDLHAFIPSLQTSPFAVEASLFGFSPAHTPPPPHTLAAGLSPIRYPLAQSRSRPGSSRDSEVCVDDVDAACEWEEVRRRAALRDMEPNMRRALLHRLAGSLDLPSHLDGVISALKDNGGGELPLSCPPAMPSSLSELTVQISEIQQGSDHSHLGIQVEIFPPAPLCPGAGAVSAFFIEFTDVLTREGVAGSSSVLSYELDLCVSSRGNHRQRVRVRPDDLGEDHERIAQLWQPAVVRELTSDERCSLVTSLVKVLQRKSGRVAAEAVDLVASCASTVGAILRSLPADPVPILIHQVPVSFSRSEPLTLSAFDTGKGVLLLAETQGVGYREKIESELNRLDENVASLSSSSDTHGDGFQEEAAVMNGEDPLEERQTRLSAAASAASVLVGEGQLSLRFAKGGGVEPKPSRRANVCVASAEIPSVVFGASREPLLMTPAELERILLGSSKQSLRWREQRRGFDRREFLALELSDALAYVASALEDEEQEVGGRSSGVLHWVAPFTGDTKFGTVVRRHADGFVDVRMAADAEVLRRVDPAEVKVPIRSDKKLQRLSKLDQATSRDHHPLRSKAAYSAKLVSNEGDNADGLEVPTLSGEERRLEVGCAVQVFTKREPSHLTPSTKVLQYARGEAAYALAVSGDSFTKVGDGMLSVLPVHLRLLLGKDPEDEDLDAHGCYPESLPIDSSSVAAWLPYVCVGVSALASMATVTTRLTKSKAPIVVVEEEDPEVAEERARRQKLSEIFYKRMTDKLLLQGDLAMRGANALSNHNNVPVEYPPEEDLDSDDEEEPEVVAARKASLALDAGETEGAARKRVLRQRRLLVEAKENYKQALRRSPILEPRVFGRLSTVLLRLRHYGEAYEYTLKAEAHFPESPSLVFSRGQALMGLKRFDEAFTAFDECLRMGDAKVLDVKLVRQYRSAAIVKRKKFVSAEDTLVLEIQSSDERQRDIDQKLNVFNVYDSVPRLTRKHELPNISHPSRLVNPLSRRLKVSYPTATTKKRMWRAIRSRERAKARTATPKEAPSAVDGTPQVLSGSAPQDMAATGPTEDMLWGDDEDSSSDEEGLGLGEKRYIWEEDEEGEADDDVLFELELETPSGVLELTVRKGDDVPTVVEELRSKNPGALTHKQAHRLMDDLISQRQQLQLQNHQPNATWKA